MGAATARLLARDGAAVLIADLSSKAGQQVSMEIRATGGQAEFARTDVSDPDSIHAMVDRAVDGSGSSTWPPTSPGYPRSPRRWLRPPSTSGTGPTR